MALTDVVIPVRNEERTIAGIVAAFAACHGIGSVIVAVDADTTDHTAFRVPEAGGHVVLTGQRGKGQVIRAALDWVESRQVILCDGDLGNFTSDHAGMLIGEGHTVGVPDFPLEDIIHSPAVMNNKPWFNRIVSNWGLVSGQRNVPTWILRGLELHGYLTEVQIIGACVRAGLTTKVVHLNGVYSPFIMSEQRLKEMQRDREWGVSKGILER
jgi:hypothetical protein